MPWLLSSKALAQEHLTGHMLWVPHQLRVQLANAVAV
jgi:hypothetical protein